MSTVDPEDVRALQAAAPGLRLLDAPVSGGVLRAANGTLTVMAGGVEAEVAEARPVLSALGSNVFHCGGLGSAQIVKVVNNVVCIASTVITAEAFRIAQDHGVDLAELTRVLEVSTGRSYLTNDPAGVPGAYAAMALDPRQFAGLLAILRKDLRLAAHLAGEPGPALASLAALLDTLGDETFETWRSLGARNTQGGSE